MTESKPAPPGPARRPAAEFTGTPMLLAVARLFTDTFSGISLPASVPAFLAPQLAGALAATGFFAWLHGHR